jgi:SAM-dependent methyltransferase
MDDLAAPPVLERRIGVARAKRRILSPEERAAALIRARAILAAAGVPAAGISPLALTDVTQTYHVRRQSDSAILKLVPRSAAASVLAAQAWLGEHGVELPAVLWADAAMGAVLYEDVGTCGLTPTPDPDQLAAAMAYLARLHAAGIVDRADAEARRVLGADGVPTPATWAARLLTQLRPTTPANQRTLLEIAATLARWIGEHPRIVIGDLKREHLRVRRGAPLLTDLELATIWDVPPSNLATLLAFPGQFEPAIDRRLRRWLIERYADEHDRLEGTRTDVDDLERAVECAEMVLAASLAEASELDGDDGSRSRPAPEMIRNRSLFAGATGMLSIERELGPALFARLVDRLNADAGLRVLDLGCGDGEAVGELLRRWPRHRVVGLDRQRGAANRRVIADATALPFGDASIDVAFGVQLLQYVPDKVACLQEVQRVLAPDGLALFAMTEHFEGASAFVPPLFDMARSWAGAVHDISVRRLAARRVLTFALSGTPRSLRISPRLVEIQRAGGEASDPWPYVRSIYREAMPS